MPHTPENDGVADALAPAATSAAATHAGAVPADPVSTVTDADDAAVGGLATRRRPPGGWQDDTGDVPGWVLVTLMTAALVVGLWAVAGPALTEVFQSAIERVTSSVG